MRILSSSVQLDISLVRYAHSYRVKHEKIKFISTSGHVIFCLLYKHTNNDVFDDFPKISEDFPKLFRRFDERFRTLSEDYRRFPKVAEEGPMMFRSYNDTSEYFFKDYVAIPMAILRFVTTTCYFHV